MSYCKSWYRLSKIARKYIRGLTKEFYQKCKNDTIVSDETNFKSKMLDWFVTLKGEPRNFANKID